MASYFSKKVKHAYKCFKKGKPRKKVYAAVEKGDKFVVLKGREGASYKYNLAGGTIEKRESVEKAIKREILEELNIKSEFVKSLGVIKDKSKWNYKGEEFWVTDEMEIVLVKFVSYGKNKSFGISGEFTEEDKPVEITKEEMLNDVYEFTKGGLKL